MREEIVCFVHRFPSTWSGVWYIQALGKYITDGWKKWMSEKEICSSKYGIRPFMIFDTSLDQMSDYSQYSEGSGTIYWAVRHLWLKWTRRLGQGVGSKVSLQSVRCLGSLLTLWPKILILKQKHSRTLRLNPGLHLDSTPTWGRQVVGPYSCSWRGPFSSCFHMFIQRAWAILRLDRCAFLN